MDSPAPAQSLALPPAPLTSLVGRDYEADAAAVLLRTEGVRLLTLVGPGGVGKTRLAIRVAIAVAAGFPGGVAWVPLASVRDPALLLPTVTLALGFNEPAVSGAEDWARSRIGARKMLLVLDNCEQLLPQAAPVVASILRACPQLTVLVTTQSLLRVDGEHAFPLLPLTAPPEAALPVERLGRIPAVQLFVDRARAANPRFALDQDNAASVAEICRRLDGLPLALELAAAWTRIFAPPALLARMELRLPLLVGGPSDQPDRLRTMRGAVTWSYELLDQEQQQGLLHLAVFAGGFGLDAAAAVLDEWDTTRTLALVTGLVDRSLLRTETKPDGEPRFSMLETVREFALERLGQEGDVTAVRARHAAWCLRLARDSGRHHDSAAERRWMDRLEAERGNFQTALETALAGGEPDAAEQLALALYKFWLTRGHLAEGRHWLERVVAGSGQRPIPPYRGDTLHALGTIAMYQGDFDVAEANLSGALAVHQERGDARAAADDLAGLGGTAEYRGDDAVAVARYTAALAAFVELGDDERIAMMRANLADAAVRRGDLDEAADLLADALPLARRAGRRFSLGFILVGSAQVAIKRGALEMARQYLREALTIAGELADPGLRADALAGVARLAMAVDNASAAARLLGGLSAILDEIGMPMIEHHALQRRTLAGAQAALGDAEFTNVFESGRALASHEVTALAVDILAAPVPEGPSIAPERSAMPSQFEDLTPREWEVLCLLGEGLSNKEMAEHLCIGLATVKTHVTRVLAKCGVPSRAAATALAHRHGLTGRPGRTNL